MPENKTEIYAGEALVKFFNTATENITMSATINRALIDKISTETINTKVSNQYNSIQTSMYKINPKFNEKSKNYDIIKKDILDVLTDYEDALKTYSKSFDKELEKLLLKKVELENKLVIKIFTEENFKSDETKEENKKKNDRLKIFLGNNQQKIVDGVSNSKKENKLNFYDLRNLKDNMDIEKEQDDKLNKKIERIQEKNKTNMAEIAGIERDIKNINQQISDLSEKKKQSIIEAMEKTGWVSVNVKKPHVFSRVTRFFSNKLNSRKAIDKTVIEPLKIKVSQFKMEMSTNQIA